MATISARRAGAPGRDPVATRSRRLVADTRSVLHSCEPRARWVLRCAAPSYRGPDMLATLRATSQSHRPGQPSRQVSRNPCLRRGRGATPRLALKLACRMTCVQWCGQIGRGGAGQVFISRRTSLRAESSSRVFARSRRVPEDKVPGLKPEGSKIAGSYFQNRGAGANALAGSIPGPRIGAIAAPEPPNRRTDRARWVIARQERKEREAVPSNLRLGLSASYCPFGPSASRIVGGPFGPFPTDFSEPCPTLRGGSPSHQGPSAPSSRDLLPLQSSALDLADGPKGEPPSSRGRPSHTRTNL